MRKQWISAMLSFLMLALVLVIVGVGSASTEMPVVIIEEPAGLPAAILVVDSTLDSGPGTLRQAMLDAQSDDTIMFDPSVFPPSAPVSISITSGTLPPSFRAP